VIVLDTHAWLWLVSDPSRLGPEAIEWIDRADGIAISPISCWEIAMLVVKGRIELGRPTLEWMELSLSESRATLVPIDPTIASLAATLPMHGDPADRLIVATALSRNARLVTKDQAIQQSGLVSTVW
jgi:PIN domain nuclease of toxin-antitoxin system